MAAKLVKIRPGSLILLLMMCAVLAYTLGYIHHHYPPPPTSNAEQTPSAVPSWIASAQPVLRTFTPRLPWLGTVESQASVALTALINGRIEVVTTEDQAPIKVGELVMQLGGFQVEKQRSGLQAEIESLTSRLELARQTAQRLEDLMTTQLVTNDRTAAAQETQIKLEAQLHQAQLNLEIFEQKIHITAPMQGIFTHRRVSVGQDVIAGQVVGNVVDPNHLRIVASLFPGPEMEISGLPVTIDRPGNSPLTGFVRRVLPQAETTGAMRVWIEGPDIDKHLRPGQTVGGNLVIEAGPETLAVPESAVVYDEQEHPLVFIRNHDTYEPCPVQTGLEQDGWVAILSGLQQDQVVVTRGTYELFYRRFNEQFKVQD